MFIVGEIDVPPVVMLVPGCIFATTLVASGNSVDKSVDAEYIVAPDKVVADQASALAVMPDPDNNNPENDGESTVFTDGLVAVPPVVVLVPFCMLVIVLVSCVTKIVLKSVLPE